MPHRGAQEIMQGGVKAHALCVPRYMSTNCIAMGKIRGKNNPEYLLITAGWGNKAKNKI